LNLSAPQAGEGARRALRAISFESAAAQSAACGQIANGDLRPSHAASETKL